MSHGLPEGTYKIENVKTGTVLDLYDGRSQEGTPVQGFKPHGGDNQKWRLKYTGKRNEVTIQNVKSKTYLGASSNIHNSVKVVGSKTAVPMMCIAADKGFTYDISPSIAVAHQPDYVLDLKESNPANETPVIYFNNNDTDNQKWKFIEA